MPSFNIQLLWLNQYGKAKIAAGPKLKQTLDVLPSVGAGVFSMRAFFPLLFGQNPTPENHAKLLFTIGISSSLRSAYYFNILCPLSYLVVGVVPMPFPLKLPLLAHVFGVVV
jgi:hypothetical protein